LEADWSRPIISTDLTRHCFCLADVDDHHQPSSAINFGIVVRRMVRDMAVSFPGPARGPDHVIPLPGSHIDGVGEEASRRRKRLTVSRDNLEWASVDMHRKCTRRSNNPSLKRPGIPVAQPE
jgi:hypothetical protein